MSNLIVIHTGETGSMGGLINTLRKNNSWSNTVYDPRIDREFVHSNNPRADRSLRNLRGGVETNNRDGVYQIEIVGYARQVPSYDDDWYRNLGNYLRRKADEWDVPFEFPYEFIGNQAYGYRGAARLTTKQWNEASGIVGHQHVPENTHWDPGALDVERLLNLVEPVSVVEKHPELAQRIARTYETILQRDPDEEGLEYWVTQMLEGLEYADLLREFLAVRFSEEA